MMMMMMKMKMIKMMLFFELKKNEKKKKKKEQRTEKNCRLCGVGPQKKGIINSSTKKRKNATYNNRDTMPGLEE